MKVDRVRHTKSISNGQVICPAHMSEQVGTYTKSRIPVYHTLRCLEQYDGHPARSQTRKELSHVISHALGENIILTTIPDQIYQSPCTSHHLPVLLRPFVRSAS